VSGVSEQGTTFMSWKGLYEYDTDAFIFQYTF